MSRLVQVGFTRELSIRGFMHNPKLYSGVVNETTAQLQPSLKFQGNGP